MGLWILDASCSNQRWTLEQLSPERLRDRRENPKVRSGRSACATMTAPGSNVITTGGSGRFFRHGRLTRSGDRAALRHDPPGNGDFSTGTNSDPKFCPNIYLAPDSLYSLRRYIRTINRPNTIGVWQAVNIDQRPRRSGDTVDYEIQPDGQTPLFLRRHTGRKHQPKRDLRQTSV